MTPGSVAAAAGLLPGDKVASIGGAGPVATTGDLYDFMDDADAAGTPVSIDVTFVRAVVTAAAPEVAVAPAPAVTFEGSFDPRGELGLRFEGELSVAAAGDVPPDRIGELASAIADQLPVDSPEAFAALFAEIDSDNDGELSGDELGVALKRLANVDMAASELAQVMKFFDLDGSGSIKAAEFRSWVLPRDCTVAEVTPGSDGEAAGVRVGDRCVALDGGGAVASTADLYDALDARELAGAERVVLAFSRG